MKFEYLRSLFVTSFVALGGICFLFFLRGHFQDDSKFLDLVSLRLLGGPIFILASLGWGFPASRYSQRHGALARSLITRSRKNITINIVFLNALLFSISAFYGYQYLAELLVVHCPLNAQASFLLIRTLRGEYHASSFQLITNGVLPIMALALFFPLYQYLWSVYFISILPLIMFTAFSLKAWVSPRENKAPTIRLRKFRFLKSVHGLSRRLTPYVFITVMPLIGTTEPEVLAVVTYLLRSVDVFVGAFFRISQVFMHKIKSSNVRTGLANKPRSGWPIILVTIFFVIVLSIIPQSGIVVLSIFCCLASISLQVFYERYDSPMNTMASAVVFYIPIFLSVLKHANLS